MRAFFATLLAMLVIAAVGVYSSAFIVHQNEQAMVLRFGEPKRVLREPGLNWKVPFVDTVDFFDKRILDLDTAEQEVTAADQKRIVVDAFTRYRITDPLKFYQNVRSELRVRQVLGPVVESAIRRVLGNASLQDVVKDKRESMMREIRSQVNTEGKDYGIEVVDVRLKRVDLPPANLDAVFKRMNADRVREATELRAQGEAQANRIRANAEREATVILAEAKKQAEKIRGEGDGEKTRITAEAFNRDAEFYAFYRSIQAYEQSIRPGETRMLLSPDSEFFRYFNNPTGNPAGAPKR
jgi:membrane protease subunit HflC